MEFISAHPTNEIFVPDQSPDHDIPSNQYISVSDFQPSFNNFTPPYQLQKKMYNTDQDPI